MPSEIKSLSSMVPRSLSITDGFGLQVDWDIIGAKIRILPYPPHLGVGSPLLDIQSEHVLESGESGVRGISSVPMLNLPHQQVELLDRKGVLWVAKWKGRDVRI
jgi:hypothetical protein